MFGFQRVGEDVWISTDRGLYRARRGALARVGLEQGMPVDTVFQLVADRLGNAWISSNRGVLRTELNTLNAVAEGAAGSASNATAKSMAWATRRPMAALARA